MNWGLRGYALFYAVITLVAGVVLVLILTRWALAGPVARPESDVVPTVESEVGGVTGGWVDGLALLGMCQTRVAELAPVATRMPPAETRMAGALATLSWALPLLTPTPAPSATPTPTPGAPVREVLAVWYRNSEIASGAPWVDGPFCAVPWQWRSELMGKQVRVCPVAGYGATAKGECRVVTVNDVGDLLERGPHAYRIEDVKGVAVLGWFQDPAATTYMGVDLTPSEGMRVAGVEGIEDVDTMKVTLEVVE
jgi:hypothetical protein